MWLQPSSKHHKPNQNALLTFASHKPIQSNTALACCMRLGRIGANLVLAFLPARRLLMAAAFSSSSSTVVSPPISSSAPHLKKDPARLAAVERLLKDVYGDWDALLPQTPSLFPKPMKDMEAGPSMVPYGHEGDGRTQRRYLWTDAWGVLGFATLALRCEPTEENRRTRLLQAGAALIDAVHATLGRPRSPNFPMLAAEEAAQALGPDHPVPVTLHGFVGLRIGKERARRTSDAGMTFDGMYAHYLDKWMFALLRFSQASSVLGDAAGAETYLSQAEQLVKAVHPFFMQHDLRGEPRGLYWKLNVDMSPIPGLQATGPNDDALAWWVVYSLIRHARTSNKADARSPIEQEWAEVDRVAGAYVKGGLRCTSDPLGYGLFGWKAQWMGPWAEPLRARLQVMAPMGVLDVESGMLLPFRLYGALLGGRLLGSGGAPPGGRGTDAGQLAERALAVVTGMELADQESPHASINKCMLAAALDTLAFARWEGEPTLPMPGLGPEAEAEAQAEAEAREGQGEQKKGQGKHEA